MQAILSFVCSLCRTPFLQYRDYIEAANPVGLSLIAGNEHIDCRCHNCGCKNSESQAVIEIFNEDKTLEYIGHITVGFSAQCYICSRLIPVELNRSKNIFLPYEVAFGKKILPWVCYDCVEELKEIMIESQRLATNAKK